MFILSINPGSTSTKLGIFEGERLSKELVLRHSTEELSQYPSLIDQLDFRADLILSALKEAGFGPEDMDVIIGRGGLLRPIEGGLYEVSEAMLEDLRQGRYGLHASNLGALLAKGLSKGRPCYIADPVVVDELSDLARISGHPAFPRRSIFHALNQKAMARRYAKEVQRPYEELSLIVVHLGGGISVGYHAHGRVVDVNNALDGEGPFSPERAGTVAFGALIEACFKSGEDPKQIRSALIGKGGMVAHLGTNDMIEVGRRMEAGDAHAALIFEAMAYQVSKQIGSMAAVAKGRVDAILLTGGLAYSKPFCALIEERVAFISKVKVYPGEDELEALAHLGLALAEGKIAAKVYPASDK